MHPWINVTENNVIRVNFIFMSVSGYIFSISVQYYTVLDGMKKPHPRQSPVECLNYPQTRCMYRVTTFVYSTYTVHSILQRAVRVLRLVPVRKRFTIVVKHFPENLFKVESCPGST